MQYSVLYQELQKILNENYLPLHMPGHKRRLTPCPALPYEMDLTEITGTDNLHAPTGILKEAMERTAALYRAQKTYYLVNGSTGGILAAIHALAPYGSEVIVARNCHKAVYHALELRGLRVHWIFPAYDTVYETAASVTPDSVLATLKAYPESKCVILTSPTYEGVLSDVAAIADICHEHQVPLFVDGAHGAHLDFSDTPAFPAGPLSCRADLVVESMHKTLPSLTGTALLHLNSRLISPESVRHALEIYETSSPSYPLMVSLDACTGFLATEGENMLRQFSENLKSLNEKLSSLTCIKVLCYGQDSSQNHPLIFAHDPSKILIHCNHQHASAEKMNRILRDVHHMETEMLCGNNVLAMMTIADEDSHISALGDALLSIDRELNASQEASEQIQSSKSPLTDQKEAVADDQTANSIFEHNTVSPESVMTIADAIAHPAKGLFDYEHAAGKIAGEYLFAYPPGIPLIVPGERLTKKTLASISSLESRGTRLYHSHSANELIVCLSG